MTLTRVVSRLDRALAGATCLGVLFMVGCTGGLAPASPTSLTTAASATLKGRVHGGQQAVSGASIQLYAVGLTGHQSASTPLLTSPVMTGSDGGFGLTGDWNCTSNTATYGVNPELYLVATGGNPGLSAGTDNQALAMVTALGPCNTVTSSSFIWVNEITTVAAVYALAPFMADVAHVGATSGQITGIANAFQVAAVLANSATGAVPGPALPATATAPSAEINSLADLIASCVNSSGTASFCQTLFTAATSASGTVPTDTVGVLLNIAHNPASNAATLFNMIPAAAPFQPILTAPPTDWTVALHFTGGGLSSPTALALDATGNVWVANAGGDSVTELSPQGVLLTGNTGYNGGGNLLGAQGIAIDKSGDVWVADTLLSSVVEIKVSGGVIQSSSNFTNGGINGPTGIAIDSQNNVWIANSAGGSVTELSSSGTAVGASPLTAGGTLQAPSGIAIDSSGRVWVSDTQASDLVEFDSDQSWLSGAGDSDDAILAPQGIAIDSANRVWVAYQGTNAASYYANGLNAVVSSPYTGGGLSMPTAVAIDGVGNIWITNDQTNGSLTELSVNQSTPLTPAIGLGSLNAPSAIAIDASGNLWTANAGDNSVSEFVGIAASATVPLVSSVGP